MRNPVPAAKRTILLSPFSVMQPLEKAIELGREKDVRYGLPLCTLADEADGIAVDKAVPSSVVKRNTH
jgi:hypothetical protein